MKIAALLLTGVALVGCASQVTAPMQVEPTGTRYDFASIVKRCQPAGIEKYKPGSMFLKGLPEATPTGFVVDSATSGKAFAAAFCVLEALKMPPKMKVKLDATTGVMGAQDYLDEAGGMSYTWSYSKDQGLTIVGEVISPTPQNTR